MKRKNSNDTQNQRKRRSRSTVINLTEDTSSEESLEISKIKDKKLNKINMKKLYIKIKRENLQKKLKELLKDQVKKKSNTSRKNEKTKNNSMEKMKKTSRVSDEDNESPSTSRNNETKRNSRKRKIKDSDESSMNSSYENKRISRTVNVNKKSVQKQNGIQKINSNEKNKTQKRRSRKPKEISEETIKEKFGVKFTKCYVKIKRLKQSVLKSNLSLKQRSSGPPRSVSFVDTVEVFGYYSLSRGALNTSSPSTSKEENEKRINDTSINEEIHEIGMTSTPNKQEDNEPESEKRHSKKRKIIESDSDSDSDNFTINLLTKNKNDMIKENDKNSLDIENKNDKIEKNENKSEDNSNKLKATHENQNNIEENDDEEITNSSSNEKNQIENSEKLSERENKNERENLIDNEEIDKFNVHGRKSYKENKSFTKNEDDKIDEDKDDSSVDNDSANTSKPINREEKDEQFHDAVRNNDDDDDDERQKSSDLLSSTKSVDSYKSAKNDIDNVNTGVEKSTKSKAENDVEDLLLTDDEDVDAVKQNDKDDLIESSIVKNADNNDDSNDSFFGLSKVNENKTINTEDLFDIVKNSDVSAKLPLPTVNEKIFEEHNDTDIEDINTIDDKIDGSDSNRNSPSSILLKSNPNLNQIKYDEKITKSITTVTETVTGTLKTTATTITSTTTSVLNNDNDDNFCDISNEYIMEAADTTENPTDLLNDIDSLQFPDILSEI